MPAEHEFPARVRGAISLRRGVRYRHECGDPDTRRPRVALSRPQRISMSITVAPVSDSTEPNHTTPSGTPGGRDNHLAMIAAAAVLFAKRGFDATSMDAIAAAAAVSKPTLYRHFANKQALFAAALQSLLEQLPSPEAMILTRLGTLRNRLTAIAHDALCLGTGPLMASLHRMLSLPMESASYREERFWDSNLQPYHDAMQRLLAAERDAGTLDVADVARATSHFFSMIAGEPMVRLFLTGDASMPDGDVDRDVDAAVDAFLRAYQTSRC
jgi:TetR/AcrR family transcriptional regulator, mexJK operon transcriptional repressor